MLKQIPEFPLYYVDELGENVYSFKPCNETHGKIPEKPHIIKKFIRNKYWTVLLCQNKVEYKRKIAYCVLTAFVSPRPNGQIIRHGVKGALCDSLENLCWGTPQENMEDKKRDGTYLCGETVPNAKLNNLQVRIIRRSYSPFGKNGLNRKDLSEIFNVSIATIKSVISKRVYKNT